MGMNRFRNACQPGRFCASSENSRSCNRAIPFPLSAWEHPVGWTLPTIVSGQHFSQRSRKHQLAVLVPFAASNPDDLAGAVNVADLEVGYLRNPQAGTVQGRQDGAMAEVLRSLQNGSDLFL